MDVVRGIETHHIRFAIAGQAGWGAVKVNDRYESWLDARSLSSLRYVEDIHDPGYSAHRVFEMYPEQRQFRKDSEPPEPSVDHPLDEGSFLYFIRIVPLEVGQTYTFPCYFKPDRNPVTVYVDRKDTLRLAGRTWEAVVIRPTILTQEGSLFSKDAHAEIWIATDRSHIILKLQSSLAKGASLKLELKSYKPPPAAPGSKSQARAP